MSLLSKADKICFKDQITTMLNVQGTTQLNLSLATKTVTIMIVVAKTSPIQGDPRYAIIWYRFFDRVFL